MSRYAEAFEQLAERGISGGATALLDRVDMTLSSPSVVATPPPQRRRSAWLVAAGAFLAVLAVGTVWALIDPGDELTGSGGIEWIELPSSVGGPFFNVESGPNGFVRYELGGALVEYSPDGRSWTTATPAEASPSAIFDITSSDNHWLALIEGLDEERQLTRGLYVSSDGREWDSVDLPDELDPYLQHVLGTSDGFAAVSRDPLGSGTSLWWSADGIAWSRGSAGLPGSYADAEVIGTSPGIVWYTALSSEPTRRVFHSTDGSSWTEGEIALPDDIADEATGWLLEPIVVVDETWYAVGQVFGPEPGSQLLLWTSTDGVAWQYQGRPGFGSVPGQSVFARTIATVGDSVVVQTAIAEGGLFDGSTIRFTDGGPTRVSGELWATTDGRDWHRSIDVGRSLISIAGSPAGSQRVIGLYVLAPGQQASLSSPVTTTMAAVDSAELDEDGIALQNEILADGTVTRDELMSALDGWVSCMENLGVTGAHYDLELDGGYTMGYNSPTDDAGMAESRLCEQSYLDRVTATLGSQ